MLIKFIEFIEFMENTVLSVLIIFRIPRQLIKLIVFIGLIKFIEFIEFVEFIESNYSQLLTSLNLPTFSSFQLPIFLVFPHRGLPIRLVKNRSDVLRRRIFCFFR